MNRAPLVTRTLLALLFLSLAASTLPGLVTLVNGARALLPLQYEARRERQLGTWYESIEKLRRELPPKERVALITSKRDRDTAVFANYYLYPIPTRNVGSRGDYQSSADPTMPKTIVQVRSDRAEKVTYEVLRDRDLRTGRRVVARPVLSEPATTFILPLAASLDGGLLATYVTEATLRNPNASTAEVHVTFWPKGMSRTIAIAPGSSAEYYDLVHQLFTTLDRGWMRIDSTQPLRAAFYFVNRSNGEAALLPNVTAATTRITPSPLHRDAKLFLVNASDARAAAVVDGETIPLDPHAFVSRPITTFPAISGDAYPFITTRTSDGRTLFYWPSR